MRIDLPRYIDSYARPAYGSTLLIVNITNGQTIKYQRVTLGGRAAWLEILCYRPLILPSEVIPTAPVFEKMFVMGGNNDRIGSQMAWT